MKIFSLKLRLLFLPFLLLAVCFVVVYTFLNWVIVLNTNLVFLINEDITKLWLPFILPIIPIIIFIRPKLKLLQYKRNGDSFGLMMLALFAISIPAIVTQSYVSDASAKLTKLGNISDITKSEKTKCYTLNQFYIDKQHIAVYNQFTVSGKHNESFNMSIYVGTPIYVSQKDTGTATNFWIGKTYSKTISNRLSDSEKESSFKSFADDSQKEFGETDFNNFTYLERIGKSTNLSEFETAIKKNEYGKEGTPLVLKEMYEPFTNRTGDGLQWIFISLSIAILVWFIVVMAVKFNAARLRKFQLGKVEKDTSLREILFFVIPREGFFITPILIELNLLIFIIMACCGLGFMRFNADDLLHWGGNFRPYTIDGEWWRLLTNIFLHGGFMHLIGNIYGLLFVGLFLEPCIGKTKMLAIYLITGVIASSASIWWHAAIVSVGASGAIFGLYGFLVALLLLKVLPAELNKILLINSLIFVGYNLIMGLTGGVDNAAHIGGLVSGFVFGLVLSGNVKKSARMKDLTEINSLSFETQEE